MPDVIIKGMEKMPMACCECPCVNGNFCAVENKRPTFEEWYEDKPEWCPLLPAPEWISVEERLPDMGDMVKIMAVAKSAGDGVLVDSVFITHWMPQPEPTEGGDHDG